MYAQLKQLTRKPALYEKGTMPLWTDEHISKGMLEAHLDPDWDSATRKHSFVTESVAWIATIAPSGTHYDLLDLGCGPGLYAERFHEAGYQVTGVDFSERSIAYAKDSARDKGLPITYHLRDYLTLDFIEQFDLVTIINYDFGVLSTDDRASLIRRIHTALKPGGLFIFDVFTPRQYDGRDESKTWSHSDGDFFHPEPHLRLNAAYRYEDQRTFCDQHILVTEGDVRHINIWEHVFTREELEQDLQTAGFAVQDLYGSIAGGDYCEDGKEMCAVARKT